MGSSITSIFVTRSLVITTSLLIRDSLVEGFEQLPESLFNLSMNFGSLLRFHFYFHGRMQLGCDTQLADAELLRWVR